MSQKASFTVNWQENNNHLTWALISLIENSENRAIICGAEEKKDMNAGDKKQHAYECIAQSLFPQLYAENKKAIVEKVRYKVSKLKSTYSDNVKKLQSTGNGVIVSASGPDEQTSPHAVNLWKQINSRFPFFERLHRLLATRPNLAPPVIITGIGPQGSEVIHLQPQSTQQSQSPPIDPVLLVEEQSQSHLSVLEDLSQNSESSEQSSTAAVLQQSSGQSALASAMQQAEKVVSKSSSRKRKLEDAIFELHEKSMEFMQQRFDEEKETKRQKLVISMRDSLIQEQKSLNERHKLVKDAFQDGIIVREDYAEQMKEILHRLAEISGELAKLK